ncbi:CLUMA_CG004084, isoform A [Clunio marinus]|uniref:CLUMA_CG004084, isoform A n=1 Tax=Clunio marinus TaxID=568069 RepID=A0A1J1HS79_9DIPT|nr:CLUMA_CG004084, isoform A [Clunio marinus]
MKTNWRLIKYSNNIFIRIEFTNPLNIEEVKVTFHGQSDVVNEMTETYNSRCDDFQDSNTFIYDKLLNIFDIPFFPATEQDEINCSICLSYRCEENRVPVVCCDNMKCDSMYHQLS